MTRRFDAILFDMGYTLLSPHPSFEALVVNTAVRHGLQLDVERVRAAEGPAWLEANAQAVDRRFTLSLQNSQRFWNGFYDTLLRRAGLASVPPRQAADLYDTFTSHASYAFYEDVFPVLDLLRSRGFHLGVISNWEEWLHDLLGTRGVRKAFDCVIVSASVGLEKPDPAIFELAFRELGVTPERCVYVGDSIEHDVTPSIALGTVPILIDRRRKHERAALPCARITSLYQLLELVN